MAEEDLDQRLREAILGEPVDTTTLDLEIRRKVAQDVRRVRRGKWIAVASVAALLLLMVGTYRLFANRDAELCADAAMDHRTEVANHQPRRWLTDSSAIAALAAKQKIAVDAAAIAPPGYHLERGKLCRIGGRAFLHLVYSDGAREFSLFVRDHPAQSNVRMTAYDSGAEHVAPVESSRYTALIVSDESPASAQEIARAIKL